MQRLSERWGRLSARQKRWLITGAFMLVQAFIWTVVFEILWYSDRNITDTPVYYEYASRMAHGMLPYRDFASEYPPVSMLLFSLPRWLGGAAYESFVFWFQAEMLAFSWGITALIAAIAWRQWQSLGKVAGALATYTVFLLALGSIVEARFDLAAAFIILASIACFMTDRYFFAWLLLGVGVMTKVVPALIAPVFLLAHFRRRQFSEMWMGPLVMLLAALIIAAPFLLTAPANLANAFLYHAERPLQLESSWASLLLLFSRLDSSYHVSILNSYGSHNVFSTGSSFMAGISLPVTAVFLLQGYFSFFRRTRGDNSSSWTSGEVLRYAAIAMTTFIAGGKVMSPQFLIWLLPLVPLIKGADRRVVLLLFTSVLLLTQFEFPFNYWQLFLLNPLIVIEVAVRNALLVCFAVVTALHLRRAAPVTVAAASLAQSPAQD